VGIRAQAVAQRGQEQLTDIGFERTAALAAEHHLLPR